MAKALLGHYGALVPRVNELLSAAGFEHECTPAEDSYQAPLEFLSNPELGRAYLHLYLECLDALSADFDGVELQPEQCADPPALADISHLMPERDSIVVLGAGDCAFSQPASCAVFEWRVQNFAALRENLESHTVFVPYRPMGSMCLHRPAGVLLVMATPLGVDDVPVGSATRQHRPPRYGVFNLVIAQEQALEHAKARFRAMAVLPRPTLRDRRGRMPLTVCTNLPLVAA